MSKSTFKEVGEEMEDDKDDDNKNDNDNKDDNDNIEERVLTPYEYSHHSRGSKQANPEKEKKARIKKAIRDFKVAITTELNALNVENSKNKNQKSKEKFDNILENIELLKNTLKNALSDDENEDVLKLPSIKNTKKKKKAHFATGGGGTRKKRTNKL